MDSIREYVIIAFTSALVGGVISQLSEGLGKIEKYVKFTVCVSIVGIMVFPFLSSLENIINTLDLSSEYKVKYDDGSSVNGKAVISAYEEALNDACEKLIENELGIKAEISAYIDIKENGEIGIKLIRVKCFRENREQVGRYLKTLFDCDILTEEKK